MPPLRSTETDFLFEALTVGLVSRCSPPPPFVVWLPNGIAGHIWIIASCLDVFHMCVIRFMTVLGAHVANHCDQ